MLKRLHHRWHSEGGYREVLILAVPLVITTSTAGIQSFIDRLMLSWYSSDALAATVPAFLVCMTLMAPFMGVATYVSVFVAQFFGAGQGRSIGRIVWQGNYIALLSLLMVLPLYFSLASLFAWVGHEPHIQVLEVAYARLLSLSIPVIIVFTTVSGFFMGIGKASLVMWVNIFTTVINLFVDYLLIFGHWGLPALGVEGAAWATLLAYVFGTAVLLWHFLQSRYDKDFFTRQHWRWAPDLFKRLLRFGVPVGLQMQLESLAWTVFVLLIGSMGVAELTAHSIAMNVFMLAIMPLAGISVALSVLVGRRVGERKISLAERTTVSSMHLGSALFLCLIALLLSFPDWTIDWFAQGMTAEMRSLTHPLLLDLFSMVALFCVFEAVAMVLAGTLRGAGDTDFVARGGIAMNWLVLVLPVALWSYFLEGNLRVYWGFLVLSGACLCVLFAYRYYQGRWKQLSLVESESSDTS